MPFDHHITDQRGVAGRHFTGHPILLFDLTKVVGFNNVGVKAIGRKMLSPGLTATAIGALVDGDVCASLCSGRDCG